MLQGGKQGDQPAYIGIRRDLARLACLFQALAEAVVGAFERRGKFRADLRIGGGLAGDDAEDRTTERTAAGRDIGVDDQREIGLETFGERRLLQQGLMALLHGPVGILRHRLAVDVELVAEGSVEARTRHLRRLRQVVERGRAIAAQAEFAERGIERHA